LEGFAGQGFDAIDKLAEGGGSFSRMKPELRLCSSLLQQVYGFYVSIAEERSPHEFSVQCPIPSSEWPNDPSGSACLLAYPDDRRHTLVP
jgi:hypothetical protein